MGFDVPVPGREKNRRWSRRVIPTLGRFIFILCLLLGLIGQPTSRAEASPAPTAQPALMNAPVFSVNDSAVSGASAWGDYDNDDDPDLLLTGLADTGESVTTLWRNDSGTLTPVEAGLPPLELSSAAWADFDRDGYLDLLLTGKKAIQAGQILGFSGIYHNIDNPADENPGARQFELVKQLDNLYMGAGRWGDFNRDGRVDIVISGYSDNGLPLTKIYFNIFRNFISIVPQGEPLVALGSSSVAPGDYDNDGYLDLAIMGMTADGTRRTLVYHNNQGQSFSEPIDLLGAWYGSLNWIDRDGTGYLDLLLTGNSGADNEGDIKPVTRLFHYQPDDAQMPFISDSNTGLPSIWGSSVDVGDYNNDGLADLAFNGLTTDDRLTRIYLNDKGGKFSDSNAELPIGTGVRAAWVDFNSDQTLDLSLTGVPSGDLYNTNLYLNDPSSAPNQAPSAPQIMAACYDQEGSVRLDWAASVDDHTPASGLTYNLRAGTPATGMNLFRPAANPASGRLRVPGPGQIGARSSTFFTLRSDYPAGPYTWAVQAVDSSYAASAFSGKGWIFPGSKIAFPDSVTLNEDTPIVIPVLNGDVQDYGALKIYDYTLPKHGKLTVDENGSFTYSPDANWSGTDSFTYSAITPRKYCSSAKVSLTIRPVNDPPDSLTLSNNQIYEGLYPPVVIGTFQAADIESGSEGPFTYTLLDETCVFAIQGNKLISKIRFNYHIRNSYTIHVSVKDSGGASLKKTFTINILENHAPTGINLSSTSVLEGLPAGSPVGTLSTADLDEGDQFTYSFVLGAGSDGNSAFSIQGSQLVTKEEFAYSVKNVYSIRVRSVDRAKRCIEKIFTINIIQNLPPTEISLSMSEVYEGIAGAAVGRFITTDADPDEHFTYSLVSVNGKNYANDRFKVSGDRLISLAALDHTAGDLLTIRARTTDRGGKTFERDLNIRVMATLPVLSWKNEADEWASGPAAVTMSEDGAPLAFHLSLSASDLSPAEELSWSIAVMPKHGTASVSGKTTSGIEKNDLVFTPNENFNGDDTFVVRVTDPYNNHADLKVSVKIDPVYDQPTLDMVADQVYSQNSGLQVIQLSGIGSVDDPGQPVTVTLSPLEPSAPIEKIELIYPGGEKGADPTQGQILLTIGEGTSEFPFTITVDNGQPDNLPLVRTFTVTVTDKTLVYLPVLSTGSTEP